MTSSILLINLFPSVLSHRPVFDPKCGPAGDGRERQSEGESARQHSRRFQRVERLAGGGRESSRRGGADGNGPNRERRRGLCLCTIARDVLVQVVLSFVSSFCKRETEVFQNVKVDAIKCISSDPNKPV